MSKCRTPAEIADLFGAIVRAPSDMDLQCPSGLCNYVAISPFAGRQRKDEEAITWGITQVLDYRWKVGQRNHVYPTSNKRCDRVVEFSDGSKLWLEIKLAWRRWFFQRIKDNAPFYYNGYLDGTKHSHSVAGDFMKLKEIGSAHGKYTAIMVVGFDGDDGQMIRDMDLLADKEPLGQAGWISEGVLAEQAMREVLAQVLVCMAIHE